MPVVKQANSRVIKANKKRLEDITNRKVEQSDPNRKFEPFPFLVTSENRLELLRKSVMPLYDIPYEEQLESKQSYCKNALRHIAQRLFKIGTPVRLDVTRLPCVVNPIVKNELLYGYRNTNEFSIWRGIDGKTLTVGFNAFPISKHGDTVCLEPDGCDVMHKKSIELANLLQEFIRNQAKLSPCLFLGTDGGWRRFIIKNNSDGDLMLIGVASPRNLRVQEVIDERNNFRDFFIEKTKERGLNLKSLYFQPCPHNRCPHSQVPFELLYGESGLSEKMNQFTIQISPTSSFIQSTKGGEVLYNTTKKTIEDCFGYQKSNTKPLIIDVNSGDGILSLHLAELASKIVGIENNDSCVDNAKDMMKLNRIENVEYICSTTEIVLERVLEKYKRYCDDILMICQAKKNGLHSSIIEVLRNSSKIRRIIYITSEVGSDGCIENLIDLCKKGGAKSSPPFVLISATPVDVYPHLIPCEMIIALERLPD